MKYAVIKSLIIGGKNADLELHGFGTIPKIDLEKELLGETETLIDCARSSGDRVALYGMEFFVGDGGRTDVLTFHDGLLIDVAECNLHLGVENSELKVYSLKDTGLGIIVDDDIDSEIIWSKLAEHSDGILALVRDFEPSRRERVEKLQAYFSLPAVVCVGDTLFSFGAGSVESIDFDS